MLKFLNDIRNVEDPISNNRKIINTVVLFVLGMALGTFSKYLDFHQAELPGVLMAINEVLDISNFLGRFAIWVLIALCVSIYSNSAIRASINAFVFFVGMVASYYLYSNYIAGFFPRSYAMIWVGFTAVGISMVLTQVRAIKKYRHPLAEQIDEECNQPEAFWFNDFRIYLTKSFLVSVYGGKLTALDLAKVQKIRLFEIVKGSLSVITLEVTTTEQEKITVSENEWSFFTMSEEEITYLTDVFGERNIEFVCEIQSDEEDYEKDI